AWSTSQFVYQLCNNTYANDLFHVDEETGLIYTHSPFVQDITYVGNGLEIGRNYSITGGLHSCQGDQTVHPVDVSSLNPYFGDNVNPDHPIAPSMVLIYCNLGISLDDRKLTFDPTKDAFQCLDTITSSSPGTHLGYLQIGQDIQDFFNASNYLPAAKSLANAINNFAQLSNAVALGISDGRKNALNKINDIKTQLVPEKVHTGKLIEIIAGVLSGFLVLDIGALVGAEIFIERSTIEVVDTIEEEVAANIAKFGPKAPPVGETVDETFEIVNNIFNNCVEKIGVKDIDSAVGDFSQTLYYIRNAEQLGLKGNLVKFNELVGKLGMIRYTLEKIFHVNLEAYFNTGMVTMRTTTAPILNKGEILEVGSRFEPSVSRPPMRNPDTPFRLEAGSSGARRRKRDNPTISGETISIGELSFDEALNDIRNNLNQSAMGYY
ncbi:30459_t:CDS:2, partial [Racocetra persica]